MLDVVIGRPVDPGAHVVQVRRDRAPSPGGPPSASPGEPSGPPQRWRSGAGWTAGQRSGARRPSEKILGPWRPSIVRGWELFASRTPTLEEIRPDVKRVRPIGAASGLESSAMREPTRPFWLDGVPGQDVGADGPLPARADVVVIGGGITGTSVAYWLGAHGVSAVVLEARGLSGGASGRNGGHISAGHRRAVQRGVQALRRGAGARDLGLLPPVRGRRPRVRGRARRGLRAPGDGQRVAGPHPGGAGPGGGHGGEPHRPRRARRAVGRGDLRRAHAEPELPRRASSAARPASSGRRGSSRPSPSRRSPAAPASTRGPR